MTKQRYYLQKTSINKIGTIIDFLVSQGLSYRSFKERLMDFLNSHDGHDDDKQPLNGDCRNSEEVERCFWRMEIEDKQLKALRSLLFSLSSAS